MRQGGGNPALPLCDVINFSQGREEKYMNRLLTINGKSYKPAEFDVNFVCEMEDMGIALDQMENKMFNTVRAYVALSMGVDAKTAGKEISEHIRNGGSLDDISDAMTQMMEESDFFRPTQKGSDTTSQKRTRTKKAESEES